MKHIVVGNSELILTPWGSLTCTQVQVHECYYSSPPSKCSHLNSRLQAQLCNAIASKLLRRVNSTLTQTQPAPPKACKLRVTGDHIIFCEQELNSPVACRYDVEGSEKRIANTGAQVLVARLPLSLKHHNHLCHDMHMIADLVVSCISTVLHKHLDADTHAEF